MLTETTAGILIYGYSILHLRVIRAWNIAADSPPLAHCREHIRVGSRQPPEVGAFEAAGEVRLRVVAKSADERERQGLLEESF